MTRHRMFPTFVDQAMVDVCPAGETSYMGGSDERKVGKKRSRSETSRRY